MNIRQVEAFQAVMATGSISRAGERMGISQPAVSQLISHFERACGFALFERYGNKIIPTREAEALDTEVQRMFFGVQQIGRVANAIRNQSWGAISLAAFPSIARCIMPKLLYAFYEAHTDIRFRLESMRSRTLIDAVAAQHVDFGLSILKGDRPEVESTHVCSMAGVCIVPDDHRLAGRASIDASELADEPFISLGPQDQSRFMIDRVFDEAKISRHLAIEAGQSETACSFVAAKAGVAVVDPISAENNRHNALSISAFTPKVEFNIWLIKPKAARSFNVMDKLIEAIKAGLNEIVHDRDL